MIIALVGTQDKPFHRMLEYILKAVDENILTKNEKIYVQMGQTKVEKENIEKYKNVEVFEFKKEEEIQKLVEESEYIITHAGAGIMNMAVKKNKRMIIIPRLEKYKEHVNDHQIQLASNFTDQGYGILVKDYKEFVDAVKNIKKIKLKEYKSNTEEFCKKLDNIIIELLEK